MSRSELTLEQARDRFRFQADLPGAKVYLQTAVEHAYDYMISTEDFIAVALEIRSSLLADPRR